MYQFIPHSKLSILSRLTASFPIPPVRKAKFAEIEKFERKKTGARAGARHVSWKSFQLAAHTRVGLSVGREDRPPQWGVVHEHTPVSIPVFMNTKTAKSNFHRPTWAGGDRPRAPKHHTPTLIDGAFGHPSLQRRHKKKSAIFAKNHHFPFVHEQNADFAFRTAQTRPRGASLGPPPPPVPTGRTLVRQCDATTRRSRDGARVRAPPNTPKWPRWQPRGRARVLRRRKKSLTDSPTPNAT